MRVVVALKLRGRVERDVVVDELPEVGVTRRDRRIPDGLSLPGGLDEADQSLARIEPGISPGQEGEHPPEASAARSREKVLAARHRDAMPRGGIGRGTGAAARHLLLGDQLVVQGVSPQTYIRE